MELVKKADNEDLIFFCTACQHSNDMNTALGKDAEKFGVEEIEAIDEVPSAANTLATLTKQKTVFETKLIIISMRNCAGQPV